MGDSEFVGVGLRVVDDVGDELVENVSVLDPFNARKKLGCKLHKAGGRPEIVSIIPLKSIET